MAYDGAISENTRRAPKVMVHYSTLTTTLESLPKLFKKYINIKTLLIQRISTFTTFGILRTPFLRSILHSTRVLQLFTR